VSIHAFAYLADTYALLPQRASHGRPLRAAPRARRAGDARRRAGKRIAVPGPLTSAYLALRLYEPDFEPVWTPFDQIEDVVERGEVDMGLLIHEGQLTFGDRGLHLVVDMGEWWFGETGLPLPLGGNVVRKDLGAELTRPSPATCTRASRTRSSTAARGSPTPCATRAGSTRPRPTRSSGCTSTTGRSTTARAGARRCASSCGAGTRRGSSRTRWT
jgi:predicted solute-binding protein